MRININKAKEELRLSAGEMIIVSVPANVGTRQATLVAITDVMATKTWRGCPHTLQEWELRGEYRLEDVHFFFQR